jgi:hypothetical protein
MLLLLLMSDVFTNTTKPEQKGEVSQYEQTFMEAEISNALNSSSLNNQTTPAIAPTTTINEQKREAAGNDIDTLNLTIGINTYPITYNMAGGEVENITAMQQNSTLIVDLTTNDDGALTIQLPRNITDSKSPQNEDEDYIVFVDSIQSDTEEVTSNNLKQGLFLSSVVQSKVSDVPGQVDIIDVFRRSEDVPPVVDDAIKKKGIKVIWMQSGIYNKDAERKVKENGIDVVYNRCMKVEQCALIKQKLSLMHRSNTIDIDTMYRSSICFQD